MIVEAAPAKLNLALHVRSRRPDGYHELETLFAFVRDGDTVTIAPADRASFAVTGPFAGALSGEGDNLVLRAVRAFEGVFGARPAVAITLDKRLPVASGVGGGSADAAATLRGLARLTGVSSDDPRLVEIAAALGSDVPACLHGVTSIGRGRGERLQPVEGLAGKPALLVNPGVAVVTGPVFAAWDGVDRGALSGGDAATIAREGRNDLEAPARALAPVIGKVLAALGEQPGATLVRMSGSGATCFALFSTAEARDAAAAALGGRGWWILATELA
jgi:4-diphosphocytidyl-2-C-methyl-D-erythritol kinase